MLYGTWHAPGSGQSSQNQAFALCDANLGFWQGILLKFYYRKVSCLLFTSPCPVCSPVPLPSVPRGSFLGQAKDSKVALNPRKGGRIQAVSEIPAWLLLLKPPLPLWPRPWVSRSPCREQMGSTSRHRHATPSPQLRPGDFRSALSALHVRSHHRGVCRPPEPVFHAPVLGADPGSEAPTGKGQYWGTGCSGTQLGKAVPVAPCAVPDIGFLPRRHSAKDAGLRFLSLAPFYQSGTRNF